MAETKKTVFEILSAINCNEHTEKKNGLTYLSWAWAWYYVKKYFPEAFYTVYESASGIPYFSDGKSAMVKTGVTIEGLELIEYLPIMDSRNRSIPQDQITSFDVNKAIQRSLTKACARHGLGLYIYAGEDLPEALDDQEAPAPAPKPTPKKAPAKKGEASRETWIALIATNKVNKDGISAYDAYIAKYHPTVEEMLDINAEVTKYRREHGLEQ